MGAINIMARNPLRFFAIITLMGAVLVLEATNGSAQGSSGWPVYDLSMGEDYREGIFQEYPVPGDGMARENGRQSIHVARVIPGQAYRLGVKLRSDQTKKMSVSLFDRWPYAEGARPIRLATGGGLRGMQGEQEFQWWFSVDKKSAGSLLYIKIAVEPGFSSESSKWKYRVFIVDSPRSPMNSLGRGVVYHRGPSNLKLQENRPSVAVRYRVFSGVMPVRHVDNGNGWREGQTNWRPETNLIKNGDFSQGLAGWRLLPDAAKGVGVFDGKLRIWSHDSPDVSGVIQQIDEDVVGLDSLQLSMDVMIAAQAEPHGSGGSSPLRLSLCYKDVHTTTHCGDTAFRKYFAVQLGDDQSQTKDVEYLSIKTWSRYTLDFKELNPKIRRLISIELSGKGTPERDAWAKYIKLE